MPESVYRLGLMFGSRLQDKQANIPISPGCQLDLSDVSVLLMKPALQLGSLRFSAHKLNFLLASLTSCLFLVESGSSQSSRLIKKTFQKQK